MSVKVEILKTCKIERKVSTYLILSVVTIVVCCLVLLFAINETGKREIVKAMKEGGNMDKVTLDLRVFTEKGLKGKPKAILSFSDLQLIKNSCRQYVKGISFYTTTGIDEISIGKNQYHQIPIFRTLQ